MHTPVHTVRGVLGITLIVIAASCGLGDFKTAYDGMSPTPFDKAQWVACAHFPSTARYMMIDDLLANHPLVGMTRDEVVTLLGPFHDEPDYPGWDNCYYLGPERGLGVDFEWLVLEFDGDKVATCDIRRD
jgi:hypothetical protein